MRLVITLALIGATLALAACGDGDTSANPAPQGPPVDRANDTSSGDQAEVGGSGAESGATGNDADPLAREDFVQEANAICAEATGAIQALPASGSLSELAQNVPELQDIAQRELDRLRALGQPIELSERLDPAYLSLLEQQLELLRELVEATSSEDLVRAREILADATRLNLQAIQIATAYGIDQCTSAAEVEPLADEPSAPATRTEELIAAADVICRDSRALVDELREPQTVQESADVLAEIVGISGTELERLSELEPPAELAERYAEMLDVRNEQIVALELLGDALRADDRDAAGEALLESSGLNARAERLQRELGFELCGTPPVQEVPNQRRVPEPPAEPDEPS